MGNRRVGLIVIGVLVLVLALAWFDGGEEPLRPITQEITLPEDAQ